MQNPRRSLIGLALCGALLFSGQAASAADKYPDFLPTQYQRHFARFVDTRTLPERMLNAASITSQEYGRGFALIAGISKYPLMNGAAKDLAPAGEDVRKLVNYLTEFEKLDEIVVLKDVDVTEANLSFFLQRYFPRRLQQFPRSRFLFAYSGHGTAVNNVGYILTAEAHDLADTYNSIPMATLRAMFQPVVDSGFHVLALINACYSGDFLNLSFGTKRFIPKYPGAHAITAGGTNELTWHDGTIGSGSVFFETLYAALDGRAGRDGIVTVNDLFAYLQREVQISTDQQQNPRPGDLRRGGSPGGFFFFNRSPLVEGGLLPAWDADKGVPFGQAPVTAQGSTTAPQTTDELKTAAVVPLAPSVVVPLAPPAVVPLVPPVMPPATPAPCGGGVTTVSISSGCAAPLSAAAERALKPKDVFRECDNCPEMVVAPAGSFTMGSPASEPDRNPNREAQVRVTIARPFAVGRFAVTFAEWDACVADGGCKGYRPDDQRWGRDRRPVINVNWDDAKLYINWLNAKTGKAYRLLSEAEREYVTRAGTTTPFWWGAGITPQQANYGVGTGEYRRQTVPVDSFEANPWGLFNVHGNVWEWTEDCWNDSNQGNPGNGSARTTGDCGRRVVRGGPWYDYPQILRSASRGRNSTDDRDGSRGFRLARTLNP